jgi:hypothetical protein
LLGKAILDEKRYITELILSLRMECKSPIEGISCFLSRFGQKYSSVGYISGLLQSIGTLLPSIQTTNCEVLRVVFCSDEVFSKRAAILITVEPKSLAILSIELCENRKGESWEKHWTGLLEAGYIPFLLCNDEGTGMARAQKEVLPMTTRQSDTFHAISHRLGVLVERFEKAAFGAIEALYESERLVNSSKTSATWNKRFDQYIKKKTACDAAIRLSDSFTFLYHCLLEQLQLFDNQGVFKNITQVLADFDTALDYLIGLQQSAVTQQVKSIQACKGELFQFREMAKGIVAQLSDFMPIQTLQTLCLAWQTQKNSINAKEPLRKNTLKRKELHLLNTIKAQEGEENSPLKTLVYAQLAEIVQSSAAVECINSILRPYLNATKNQVTQHFLNLFMAYHNHRRFKAGVRKGKTPFELLSGQTQHKDWVEIILDCVA